MARMRCTRTSDTAMIISVDWIPGIYVAFGLAVLGLRKVPVGAMRDWLFAGINLGAIFTVHFAARDPRAILVFWVYLVAVIGMYPAMRILAARSASFWLAFALPILLMTGVRYMPMAWLAQGLHGLQEVLRRNPDFSLAPYFLGVSYLAFRCSRMLVDVRNGAPWPTFVQFLGFAFFFPVMSVGPIHRWEQHREALQNKTTFPVSQCLQRIVIGLAKAVFLAGWVGQLAYSQMFFDGHLHVPSDLAISAIAYYLYLYLNFSGYCDVAIGLAGLAGIAVPENFKNPLMARNLKEFWNRWHITLSEWMRDLVFSPMAKNLVGRVGPKYANHAIAGIILFVFVLIGVWHGRGWTFFIYGLLHGLGVVANYYYTLALKKHLNREQYLSYMANRWIEAVGILMTSCYAAGTLFFFANTPQQILVILRSLR
jgi:D-alanyl-lipoteichoic acid acyltransferase DltB (MBOAT superfamily)